MGLWLLIVSLSSLLSVPIPLVLLNILAVIAGVLVVTGR